MSAHVFTYGSLMFGPVWERVVRGRHARHPARLRGWTRRAVRGETYPALVPAPDTESVVDGVLHLDVLPDDLRRLDGFEGSDYERRAVPAWLLDATGKPLPGPPVTAQVYLWTAPIERLADGWEAARFGSEDLPAFIARHVDGFAR